MATSAIGPGFLTQTTVFTKQLGAAFAFVIVITIIIDIAVQLNIWRMITMSRLRAQDLANELLPGLGYVLAAMIVLGGIAFNTGNIAGAGLGLQVCTGLPTPIGAAISAAIALFIFWQKDAGRAMDVFTKYMGILMIVLTCYVAFVAHPPVAEALMQMVWPAKVSALAIITIVGGTVGGYISFAGAHRLLEGGITGIDNIKKVNKGAVSGIVITGIMRFVLFLAALGVVVQGKLIEPTNPAASVFKMAAGHLGYFFFGMVMWAASITSVIGASFTAISFIKTFHPVIEAHQKIWVSGFIVLSAGIFEWVGQPVKVLVMAGTMNGFILPLALIIILLAAGKSRITRNYQHALWLQIAGWLVVAGMLWMVFILHKGE
ncbi:MAG: divalent metal cation transporter [Sphingobacteriales bacterium]|nr:MAG: divalent metal cation transporter [Sphingobacteriales bacterium]